MRLLTADEFKATYGTPPAPVDVDEPCPFDFWPYVDAIPHEHFAGHHLLDLNELYGLDQSPTTPLDER